MHDALCRLCPAKRHPMSSLQAGTFSFWSIYHHAQKLKGHHTRSSFIYRSTKGREVSLGMPRLSGLQKDVLNLYRQCLRATRQKPDACCTLSYVKYHTNDVQETRPNFTAFVRYCNWLVSRPPNTDTRRDEFREHAHLSKKDFSAIEFLLRKGQRQLDMYSSPGIRNVFR